MANKLSENNKGVAGQLHLNTKPTKPGATQAVGKSPMENYIGYHNTDSHTDIKKIDKADPFTRPVFKNATKAGEVDFDKNAMERDAAAIIDKEDRY